MAKYKSNGLGHKRFFTISVLAVSALGLIFVTLAAQKPTNTQSDAFGSGRCNNFVFQNTSTTGSPNHVDYDLKIKNNCANRKSFWIQSTPPKTSYRDPATGEIEKWEVLFYKNNVFVNRDYDTVQFLKSGGSYKDTMKVYPPKHAPKGTYNIKVKTCEYEASESTDESYIMDNCAPTLNLKYKKD